MSFIAAIRGSNDADANRLGADGRSAQPFPAKTRGHTVVESILISV